MNQYRSRCRLNECAQEHAQLKVGVREREEVEHKFTRKSSAIPYYCTTDIRFSSGGCAGGTWVASPPPVGPRACIKFMSQVADMAPTAGAVSVSSVSSHWQPLPSYQSAHSIHLLRRFQLNESIVKMYQKKLASFQRIKSVRHCCPGVFWYF